AIVSTQYSFYWRIDMRNINSGILKLGCHITSGRRGSSGTSSSVTGAAYLKNLYSYSEEPSFPSSTAYKTLGSSTMT
ncbi:MAG: hypothetical protein LUC37_01305, partial [Prevotella sp.]|nr:hypothetical protein [Prevotella sp.]